MQQQTKQFFVTGIDTGIGKTVASACLVNYLQADYWKPIQSGDLIDSDSMKVAEWTNKTTTIFPERYALQTPASPHESAAREGITMDLADFQLPQTPNNLIVEGAGGLFVPINSSTYLIDLIKHLQLPVVLVTKNYLGCINHTLLAIEALRTRQIPLAYLVFNGTFNLYSLRAIKAFLDDTTQLIHLPTVDKISKETLHQISTTLNLEEDE
ncbi:MAG: dethiobiotin synthase [Flavobacteriaceae bacterium]|jgi:dethiobiotin synthetase|nr:dethiobiotin synthase [Flavobacteriaceae bacterium]